MHDALSRVFPVGTPVTLLKTPPTSFPSYRKHSGILIFPEMKLQTDAHSFLRPIGGEYLK